MAFNPAIHHRRSIRLKGHDYSGGGLYFVTICAHRRAGDIFAEESVRAMVGRVWEAMPESAVGAGLVSAPNAESGAHEISGTHEGCRESGTHEGCRESGTHEGCRESGTHEGWGTHEGCPYVVMPDHFHALVRMRAGDISLGDVVGAFKSLVVHDYIEGVRAGRLAPFPGKIWHRNYYERIVRSEKAERNIARYIRMNPWRLVQHADHEGQTFRMIGNPALLGHEKIAVLCSRNCPQQVLEAAMKRAATAGAQHCFISGFHSPAEQAILAALLRAGEGRHAPKLICCPAWGIETMRIPPEWLPALEANRMLILEMYDSRGNLAASEARNRFVLGFAKKRWLPHVSPGGMLDRLRHEVVSKNPAGR